MKMLSVALPILFCLGASSAQAMDINPSIFPRFESPEMKENHEDLRGAEGTLLFWSFIFGPDEVGMGDLSNEVRSLARAKTQNSGLFQETPDDRSFFHRTFKDHPLDLKEEEYFKAVQSVDSATGDKVEIESKLRAMETELDQMYGSHRGELQGRRNHMVNQMRDPMVLKEAQEDLSKQVRKYKIYKSVMILGVVDFLLRSAMIYTDHDPGILPIVALPTRAMAKGVRLFTEADEAGTAAETAE